MLYHNKKYSKCKIIMDRAQEIIRGNTRRGKWSKAEKYLFQCLLEKFGRNWAKIHQHMPQRSAGQIRSYGQKFFDKVGPAKTQEYQRTADLIEAYETLEREKVRRSGMNEVSTEVIDSQMVKIQPETVNYFPFLLQADSNIPVGFMNQLGSNLLFLPYENSQIQLNNLHASSNETQ